MNPEREDAVERDDTPGCNCASRGMLEGVRHGPMCPYGLRKLREWQEANSPPVEDMTCEEALAEAQTVSAHWRSRALAAQRRVEEAEGALDQAVTMANDHASEIVSLTVERDALAGALREIRAVLGPGAEDCEENACDGCKWEIGEAVRLARSALTANPQASDG